MKRNVPAFARTAAHIESLAEKLDRSCAERATEAESVLTSRMNMDTLGEIRHIADVLFLGARQLYLLDELCHGNMNEVEFCSEMELLEDS